MKRISLRILFAIVLSFLCVLLEVGYASSSDATDNDAVLGREFKIKYGQEVTVEGQDLIVKFISVNDSRCPEGSKCIWEGFAEVVIGVGRTKADESQVELYIGNLESGRTSEGKYQQYVIRLVALYLRPRTDVERKPSDYVATLLITKE
jgi:hypothetical protein